MRPSTTHEPKHLVQINISGEAGQSHVNPHRLRRVRKQTVDSQDQQHTSSTVQKITHKDQTPPTKSHSSFDLPSRVRKTKAFEMPSGTALPSSALRPKLTKTGRVSKAKKGVKGAHSCGCGKTYSRAEHLRRHQQNHEMQLPCPLCGKPFHRQDLYDRHLATKHSGDSSGSLSRRDSATSESLISSSAPQPSLSPAFEAVMRTTSAGHPEDTRYLSVREGSPLSSREHPRNAPSSPSSSSDTSYIKDEPYAQPYFTDANFGELNTTSAESHPPSYLAARPSHPSSGNVSPFSPFAFSASWAETNPIYSQLSLAESISFAFNSSTTTSPRIFSTHMQLPGWMESGTDVPPFPASAITSPSSSCAPAIALVAVPLHPNGAPYPLTFVSQPDKYGSLDLESPLEEQQLGIDLNLKTKQHYVEAYWAHFHPIFPILHKVGHRTGSNPLLVAAMMAIGAQYTDKQFARADSRILHEKCLELIAKYKQTLSTTGRIDYMQAIFLVEVFSHFKAKRAAPQLSDVFLSIYASLWKFHSNTGRSSVEGLGTVQPQLNDDQLKVQWAEWVATTSFARLLTACYIFEMTQALVLVRLPQSAPVAGFELFLPAAIALWDATNHVMWSQIARSQSSSLTDVAEVLDSVCTNDGQTNRFEPFQSMMLTASYAASVLHQKQELQSAPFNPPTNTHPLFEYQNIGALERVLSTQTNSIIIYNLARIASITPLRALLATSGESWVLSERLSQEALLAAAEFTSLKAEMRAWTNTGESSFFQGTIRDTVQSAIQQALNIIRACVNVEPSSLSFGSEMALYYGCLVLWAVTLNAVRRAEATGLKFEPQDGVELEPLRAQHNTRAFCDLAKINGIVTGEGVHDWHFSVGEILRWSAWFLGGAGMRSSGLGELMEGAVGVLERLSRRGWNGDWF